MAGTLCGACVTTDNTTQPPVSPTFTPISQFFLRYQQNHSVQHAAFTFESMTSDGNFATLTGSYISPNGGYGKFTFIVENVNGRFFVNDMYYDAAPDMVDKLVRPEFINSPTPNYWQIDENLDAAEKILTAVQ